MTTVPGTRRMRVATAVRRGILFGCVAAALLAAGAVRAQSFSEYDLPRANASPSAIAKGPDGNVWFTESLGSRIGRITMDGEITEFPVPSTQPSGITTGPDGNLWFTEGARSGNRIGRITPAGDIDEFSIPTPGAALTGITAGPDGNLWFTEFQGDKIGRITTSGTVTEWDITATPNGTSSRWPFQITAGPDGNLWFTEVFNNAIGRITPQGVLTEFPVSTDDCPTRSFGNGLQLKDCSLSGITAGPDGNIWYVKSQANKIGRITTTGTITEFSIPSFDSAPYGITAGADGNLWFTENAGNKIARITPAGVISEYVVPTDDSQPRAITTGPDGALWFTESKANKIGRATTSPGPCAADSRTLCLRGNRFKVQLSWSDPKRGRSGVGTAIPLTEDTGYFWFFKSDNVELVIKALDGRSNNGYFWIFYGSLSSVQYTITVTDTVTGNVKTYENAFGTLASKADTSAFGTTAGVGTVAESVDSDVRARADEELSGLYAELTTRAATPPPQAAANDLCSGGRILCLNQSRFLVSVDWQVPSKGRSGEGSPAAITDETGYFWFFNPDNVELVVKVLDARGIDGHFWVFYGGLSGVQYTITITDTQTQQVRTYTNPSGTVASFADTNAFTD